MRGLVKGQRNGWVHYWVSNTINLLASKHQLLILDEATAAMDKNTEAFVLDLLEQLKKNMMIVFISHREHRLRQRADRLLSM